MIPTNRLFVSFLALALSTPVLGDSLTSSWSEDFTATTASGQLADIAIVATTSESAPILSVTTDRFVEGGDWDTDLPLLSGAQGLAIADVNEGDRQEFQFGSPITNGMLYIENFDSNSSAKVTAIGTDAVLDLIAASPSITFADGQLTTSNPESNGEGDAVLEFSGDVTGIMLDYSAGDGSNGVFYTFAMNASNSVPEPASGVLALLASFGVSLAMRKRIR